ncbi:MAG TPA: hypothetical protein VLW85_22465, partial [Myxococcales bacterium]|nr:hypothetical protein [Myxococcales bacterium]
HGPNGTFAYVVGAGNVAEMRPLVLEATQGDIAIIRSGLSAGEQVVVDGQAQLRPGSKISPRPVSASGTSASAGAGPHGGPPSPSSAPSARQGSSP